MRYVLAPKCLSVLTRLAGERTLCAFDFDGTLAPIVERPDQVLMRVRTRQLLAALASMYPCVILSGRSGADVLSRLGGVQVERVIGNHGGELAGTDDEARFQVERWKAALNRVISEMPEVWVEDKGISLAVHYRQSPRKAEARRRVLEASRTLERSRVVGGKQVINLVACNAPGKGEALASERDRLHCTWALFIGDDANDEDAFALDGNTVAVRVGPKLHSHARYYLRSQAEIDKLLDLMVSLRRAAQLSR